MMTYNEAYTYAAKILSIVLPGDIKDELKICFEEYLKIPIWKVTTYPDRKLSPDEESKLLDYVARRARREPWQYIVGKSYFMGLEFQVDKTVFIPRPETEDLVTYTYIIVRKFNLQSIWDVGTGCGAIAIALKRMLPDVEVYASDIIPLKLARHNANNVGVRVHFKRGNLLDAFAELKVDTIVCNPPYIPSTKYWDLPPEVLYEPRTGYDGGTDGLQVIKQLIPQTVSHLTPHGVLLIELDSTQSDRVLELAHQYYPHACILKDTFGKPRFLVTSNRDITVHPWETLRDRFMVGLF